jgi:hypothetical protein
VTLARAQLMGQTDREVLKATGLGMRGVAETGRRGPGRSRTDIRRSPTHCVVAFKSGSMVSHPLPVAIKWGAYGVSWLAGRMQRKRHRHRHARAGLPILCVGSAAHGHDHTDDRIGAGHLGGVFNAQRKSSGGLSIAPAMAECAQSKPWCSQTGLEPASPTRCALGVRPGLTADKALLAWRSPKLSYGRSIPKLTTSRRKCAPVSKRAYGCFHRKANFPTEKRPLRPPTCSAAHLGKLRRSQTF